MHRRENRLAFWPPDRPAPLECAPSSVRILTPDEPASLPLPAITASPLLSGLRHLISIHGLSGRGAPEPDAIDAVGNCSRRIAGLNTKIESWYNAGQLPRF